MASREDIITDVVFATIGIAIPATAVAQHFFHVDVMGFAGLGPSRYVIGWTFAALAFALAVLNAHLNCIAPWRHKRTHGDMKDYAHVSGMPIIGSVLVLFAAVLIPASPWIGSLLLAVYVADTGGLPWVLVAAVAQR